MKVEGIVLGAVAVAIGLVLLWMGDKALGTFALFLGMLAIGFALMGEECDERG